MKNLVCTQPGQLEYHETDEPPSRAGHVILKIKRIGVCGTDLHAYEGTQPFFSYPRILGHELAGEVADINGSHSFSIGEAVTFVPYFNCGKCIACRNGLPNCCVSIQVCGVHIDGGMREYLSVPVSSLVKSNGLNLDELALVEPLAIGAHGIARARLQEGEYVLVIGAGPIGLATMEFARIAGARVIALDINAQRLQFCSDRLKVEHILNPLSEDVWQTLRDITSGDMPQVVIDATGNRAAISGTLQYLAHGGRIVLIGLQKEDFSFNHPEFHKRETSLLSSRNATRKDFEQVISAMNEKLLDPAVYITHRVNFGEVKNNFDSWSRPATGVIKAMIEID